MALFHKGYKERQCFFSKIHFVAFKNEIDISRNDPVEKFQFSGKMLCPIISEASKDIVIRIIHLQLITICESFHFYFMFSFFGLRYHITSATLLWPTHMQTETTGRWFKSKSSSGWTRKMNQPIQRSTSKKQ